MTGLYNLVAALLLAAGQPTIWTGVYTPAQAERGEAAYRQACSGCHQPNLSGYDHLLVGQKFMDHWREDTLDSFYHLMKVSMPRGAPASLGDKAYLDILAFILQNERFPGWQSRAYPGGAKRYSGRRERRAQTCAGLCAHPHGWLFGAKRERGMDCGARPARRREPGIRKNRLLKN